MKTFEELRKIKYGDLLELKHAPASDLLIGRVISVHEHKWYEEESAVFMYLLTHDLGKDGHITWHFKMLQTLLNRIIESPTEKSMISLLYD